MDKLMKLEDHVIEKILGYDDISLDDIRNFKLLWKEFHSTIKSNVVPWKRVFFYRWPSAKKFYDKQKENEKESSEENKQNYEKIFIQRGIDCARQLQNYISEIIHKHENYYNIFNDHRICGIFYSDEYLNNELDDIIYKPERYLKYCFFVDEIKKFLNQSSRRTGDLTKRYGYEKLFYCIRQCSLKKEWVRLEEQPQKSLSEQMATIISEFVQLPKYIRYSYVENLLDDIARGAMEYLKPRHPNHSIVSISDETFTHWRNNNINENHWNETEGRQIMETLEEYIFGVLNFRLDDGFTLESICIDHVLKHKRGHKLIILIIYHCVTRRLGLRCDMVQMNDKEFYYGILWKPKFNASSFEYARYLTINSGEFPQCLKNKLFTSYATLHECSFSKVDCFEIWYAIHHTCALFHDLPLACFVANSNDGLFRLSFNKPMHRNTGLEEVKFAVGLIVEHNDENIQGCINGHSCTGVILAWHRVADSDVIEFDDDDLAGINKTYLLKFAHRSATFDYNRLPLHVTDEQIYYVILTDNNKMCYVTEDEIRLTAPRWIDNIEIGGYFCKFEGTHYEPNEMLANAFPDDYPTRQLIINRIEMETGVEHSS